jgi:hypothetical protein
MILEAQLLHFAGRIQISGPRLQLIDARLIDVCAEHFVTCRRQASSSHQSNVAAPNYRKP